MTTTLNNRTSPSPPSPLEAELYYAGLPSAPLLVARTSTTPWKAPTGPEAYRQPKELRPVGKHAITEVWKDLGPKVFSLLDSMKVKWTSIDVIRIVNAGEPSVSPAATASPWPASAGAFLKSTASSMSTSRSASRSSLDGRSSTQPQYRVAQGTRLYMIVFNT